MGPVERRSQAQTDGDRGSGEKRPVTSSNVQVWYDIFWDCLAAANVLYDQAQRPADHSINEPWSVPRITAPFVPEAS